MYGTDIAKAILEENLHTRPVMIYGDPDVDGLFSLLLACQFCDMQKVKYSYYINGKREHGFKLDPTILRGYLVIAVDFDIKQEMMEALIENDVAVVSCDHHDIQDTPIYVKGKGTAAGIVINNQYAFEPEENRYQSGAGITYEAICEMYPEFKSTEREALVGITLLSDARPLENERARRYLKTTYSADAQTGYLGYLVENVTDADYGFGVPRVDRDFVDFTLSPRINSLFRFGKEAEAINFILGRGLKNKSTKTKQADLKLAIKERASYLELKNITIIGVSADAFPDFPNVDIASFIGLVCSDIKGTGKSVLGFVYDNGVIVRASFRGQFDDVHYLTGVQSLGIRADGHSGAFGINDFEPTEQTWVDLDRLIGELNEGHSMTAQIIEASNLSFILMQRGLQIATENCYVRDMHRIYIRYKGRNAKIMRTTYKKEPMSPEDFAAGVKPDITTKGESWRYVRDSHGNPIPKYIEYVVDGKLVKSFGVTVEEGLILPILEKGHVQLYVRENIT